MRIRPEFAHLVHGSKVGVGVQGSGWTDQVDRIADRVLVLHGDKGLCAHYGPRAWLRVVHDSSNWKQAFDWAKRCADEIREVYQYGVRDLIPINEVIALEGLGQSEGDYRWLNEWGTAFMSTLRLYLHGRGMSDVRVWVPAMSPGHGEDDPVFSGGQTGYHLIRDFLAMADGVLVHHYWANPSQYLDGPEAEWYAARIERAHDVIVHQLGLDLPFAVGEFNRPVNLESSADIQAALSEFERYWHYLNGLDYVVAGFYFLATNTDPAFNNLSLCRMPGAFDRLAGMDRQAEYDRNAPPQEAPTVYAVDCSNYSGYLSPEQINGLKEAGVGLVIVRLPIPGVERADLVPIARQQIEALVAGGIPWQGYMWCYPEIPVERQVPAVLEFLAPIEHTYHGDILWVDVETDQPSFSADVMAWLRAARPLIEARGYAMGIYTSATMWAKAKGTDEFADCPLWDANYNGTPGQGLISYGGWGGKPLIHQYRGTSTVGGVTVDQNIVLVPEWLTWRSPAPPAEPAPEPNPEPPAWLPHLDAAWGALERAQQEIEYARGELLNLKQAAGL